ncbi:carboxylesterase family protein, partial [Streptomyces sp. SAS_269]|uniref:carboxylesterase family protein n=1 Tax=Streptomyces sp. SAS_269 TaxID=3412749 RepID=UPI00403C6D9B
MTMHRVLTTLGCALTAVLATAWSSAAPPTQPARTAVTTMEHSRPAVAMTVRTHDGLVRGAVHDGYRTFEGIPYGAPPVGRLRWAPPRRAAHWPGGRDATRPASACPQPAGEVPGGSTDEDCLHLNVTTPDGAGPARPRPVIVWLHGGGFTTGAGSSYDAHRMATRGDVVVVTVNYRLGALGFLAHNGLP